MECKNETFLLRVITFCNREKDDSASENFDKQYDDANTAEFFYTSWICFYIARRLSYSRSPQKVACFAMRSGLFPRQIILHAYYNVDSSVNTITSGFSNRAYWTFKIFYTT
jgi:hypothetical protein